MGAMQVTKVREGLWQWGCPHPLWHEGDDWDRLVWSTYFEAPEATVVIDPLLPDDPDELARFWRALDGDVERRRLAVLVLLTCAWHRRSADLVAERYGAAVVAADDPGAPTAAITRLDPGIAAPNREVAYRLGTDVLVTGDLIHVRHGELAVAPSHWHDDTAATAGWYADHMPAAAAALLDPLPALILTGHGHVMDSDAIRAFAGRLV